MNIRAEVKNFIEQTVDKYEKTGFKIEESYWEEYMKEAFKDFYLQLKYICEYMEREYILINKPAEDKSMIVYRIGNILLKIMFQPWHSIKELKEKPKFKWQDFEKELEMDEYVDIIMSLTSSIFEYYYSFLKNKETFNCTEIAKNLGLNSDIISEITKHHNLKRVYDKLSSVTSAKYGIRTNSFFPSKFVDVRNAVFHMDYYYEKIKPGNFKIYLNKERTVEIQFDELINLIHEVIPKINTIKIIPYYFASDKSTLPLKGY
ncbi:MAG TPA: hypothetical protein ENI33_02145 [Thermoplasmatales archaeon]|nr:hypothetical protein [Thermoplasmatales archaeon]